MATLRLTFTPASPAPANGYLIRYKKAGTGDPYLTATATSSPVDLTVQDGYSYEGNISSDCGGGVFSTSVTFNANIVAEPCYIYEFSNNGATDVTVYYKDCNTTTPVQTLVVEPIGTGGTQQYRCMRSDYVIIGTSQAPPGSNSGTLESVTYARTIDPGCV